MKNKIESFDTNQVVEVADPDKMEDALALKDAIEEAMRAQDNQDPE